MQECALRVYTAILGPFGFGARSYSERFAWACGAPFARSQRKWLGHADMLHQSGRGVELSEREIAIRVENKG